VKENNAPIVEIVLCVQSTAYDTYDTHFGIASLIVVKDLPATLNSYTIHADLYPYTHSTAPGPRPIYLCYEKKPCLHRGMDILVRCWSMSFIANFL
jgi:hypothetical protein